MYLREEVLGINSHYNWQIAALSHCKQKNHSPCGEVIVANIILTQRANRSLRTPAGGNAVGEGDIEGRGWSVRYLCADLKAPVRDPGKDPLLTLWCLKPGKALMRFRTSHGKEVYSIRSCTIENDGRARDRMMFSDALVEMADNDPAFGLCMLTGTGMDPRAG